MPLDLSPAEAWQPLPAHAWDAAAARHLLRRAGWTARPAEVERAQAEGLPRTLEHLFPAAPPPFARPESVAALEAELPELTRRLRAAPAEERTGLQRELRERTTHAFQDLGLAWLRFAATPGHEAFAKWGLFLGDIYVVSQAKVRQPGLIHAHQEILFRHGLGRAPTLAKAVSRSPAMIMYLDLQASRKGAPNENFARELFELFTLGEGHYTEQDIKEAARAFTGYRQLLGQVRVVPREVDDTPKTVFGRTGRFGGDDVIDLAYAQPAAATFLPGELARFYLTDAPLPAEHLAALGAAWRAAGFDLRWLARTFFGSRLFFEPDFRGNLIKSPVQLYLGLLQDLRLDVTPLPRRTLAPLRQMGQTLYQPPNVRGWVGGRRWINSATLAARRQLVLALLAPLDETLLNADERADLDAARAAGRGRFVVGEEDLAPYAALDPDAFATRLTGDLLPAAVDDAYRAALRAFVAGADPDRTDRARAALAAVLQSPDYQLC